MKTMLPRRCKVSYKHLDVDDFERIFSNLQTTNVQLKNIEKLCQKSKIDAPL